MGYTLEIPGEQQAARISAIWESGWHEAHATIVPASLCKLRTTESFHDRTIENLGNTLIASDSAHILGFCMIKRDELYQMYVSREARGLGVAQALIEDAENRIHRAGYLTAWLACAVGNDRAARFYEKSGWRNKGLKVVALDTSEGTFPLEVWRFEKRPNVGLIDR